ncbi:ABC-F family ATP-binding cassette domain-containing protein [Flavobacterium columnare]|uniref:ABC-F family ATP-binding cassette domain-containing protein n=1 Tax=Flavobacterium columnare TaxID=996 RepID=UPI001BC87C31|nr:ABC-F family ATP-binding cassette domain-containing protein [Flavobacterium columnare]AUX17579.1 ABC transporter ATP-binding protein [Flavobacterium columnare]
MLNIHNLSISFGGTFLFEEVTFRLGAGDRVGLVGKNGAGKSTLLKILSGDFKPDSGDIATEPGKRMSVLNQNHNMFDEHTVLETVLMGNKVLYAVKKEMDELYLDYNDANADRIGELQIQFEEMNGWNADSDAATLLSNLGIGPDYHYTLMGEMEGKLKVRVLLAQALFGKPDLLILDEPTNHLDLEMIEWLENYFAKENITLFMVTHDRFFLERVCNEIIELENGKIYQYKGNYSYWYESSQLAAKQRAQQNKKAEEKKAELEEFIRRFSANVAKSKQATSRKKMIEKLNISDIKPSSRRYPAIIFDQEREAGDQILNIQNLSASVDGEVLFKNVDLNMAKGDKIVLFSKDSRATSAFYEIINGNMTPDSGTFDWGVTTNQSYLPADNHSFFENDYTLVDWLRQWAKTEEERDEVYVRGFLGKMIFSGEEALKTGRVLSGGEKVRCMISRMMMYVLMLDEPTNHLDLESITAFNNSLKNFKGSVLFTTHDHEFAQTVGNRILELTPKGVIDRYMTFDEYLEDDKIQEMRKKMYTT